MHTEIHYNIEKQKEEDERALKDMANWFGDKWENIIKLLSEDKSITTLKTFRFLLSFSGVEGYPVMAFVRKYRPDLIGTEDVT